jgi:hypothetical protein
LIGLSPILLLFGACKTQLDREVVSLVDTKSPVDNPGFESNASALAAAAPTCAPSMGCENCNVDLKVGHVVFVHGYSSDQGAFGGWYNQLKDQNACAGFNTYKVSIGQEAGKVILDACTPGFCTYYDQLISCTPNQYDPNCIGHCTARAANSGCIAYDRTKNGICDPNGQCVTYNVEDGARKHISTWAEDLASFFWNNKLTDLADRSVTIVTHSTGGPAVADFMVRGYDGDERFAIPIRKVKRVINIQAALGGACGVSLADTVHYDDAISDLDDLQDGDIKYDFRKATVDGVVPWDHIQSKGEVGLFGDECEGMAGVFGAGSTGDWCDGTSHDGVTNNWVDSTSYRHPNGAGLNAGVYPYGITVHGVESKYCHTSGDDHPSYRSAEAGRFRPLFGIDPPVSVDDVRNTAVFRPWWRMVILGQGLGS